MKAIERNKFNFARILLEEGADIDQGGGTWSPLVTAVFRRSHDAAKFLLQRGADIERMVPVRRDNLDTVPHSVLYWARRNKYDDMVQLLLQHGAKDGPGSCPCQHKSGSCPFGHAREVYPHEMERVEDTTDDAEPVESDGNSNGEALTIESEVSWKRVQ